MGWEIIPSWYICGLSPHLIVFKNFALWTNFKRLGQNCFLWGGKSFYCTQR